MQKRYWTPADPHPPTPFSQASSSGTQPSTSKKKPSQHTPMVAQLTLSKNPNKTELHNHYCQVLCLPGTVENNIKAQRLQDYVEAELNMYMTKVSQSILLYTFLFNVILINEQLYKFLLNYTLF